MSRRNQASHKNGEDELMMEVECVIQVFEFLKNDLTYLHDVIALINNITMYILS